MKRLLASFLVIVLLLLPGAAFAQQQAILPEAGSKCSTTPGDYIDSSKLPTDAKEREELLGCAIETGNIHLWMLPYFISDIANFFIGIAGIISVLFTLLGGFWYMTGGVTDDQEKGKKTIMYALIGLVITLLAWIIVNVVMVQVTG